MAKYRRKPTEVEAVQWTGDNFDEIVEKISEDARIYNGCLFIGDCMPNRGEMIIKSNDDKLKCMTRHAFNILYEEVK